MKIIIAAIASRSYVQAAVTAGFDVVAIDSFLDVDTKALAQQCYQIDLFENQLDSKQLIQLLDGMDLQHFAGFCYGAGFEKSSDILVEVDKRINVLGNTANVVEKCKAADQFFRLCDELDVPHPPVAASPPLYSQKKWLQKEIGGTGGAHIKHLSEAVISQAGYVYYQQFQAGRSLSCLFLASNHGVHVIGFSEQWLDENMVEPFRYGGAVSHAEISELAKARFTAYVRQLSQAIGLKGLNSCDAVFDGDDVYVLEINPRLSATIELYAFKIRHLMAMHVDASNNKSSPIKFDHEYSNSKAHQVIYARQGMLVKQGVEWPSWVSDVPSVGSYFDLGMPVCTVLAEASTAMQAKSLVQDRAATLNKQFLN